MIGSDTNADVTGAILAAVAQEGRELVAWLQGKLRAGEITVKVSEKVDTLPKGVVF